VSGAAAWRTRGIALGMLLSVAAGCAATATSPAQCAGIVIPALRITIVDSVSGAFAGAGATLIARLGAEADTITQSPAAPDSETAFIGSEIGNYALTIQKRGYAPWTRGSVVVPAAADGCHPSTVHLQAKLAQSR